MEPILENKSVSKETAPQSSGDEDESFPEILTKVQTLVNAESTTMDTDPRDSTSTRKDDQDDQLETTKAEMDEVREENERLKQLLAKIVKDYKTLEMQFFDKLQHEDKKSSDKTTIKNIHYQENEAEMVSLSLGFGVSSSHDEPRKSKASGNSVNKEDIEKSNDELKLGLECKFEHESIDTIKGPSLESNSQEKKEEEPSEIWPPSKVLKTMRSEDDDESLRQSHLKKPRVCVRARCDTPTMNDGCQWRKYGQKIAKGNPCPRAYYRCTVSPNCPVRKQVQRCAQDMSILITTYEGNHNHPLPPSATAMASTTSAAVSMLQSRSSSSNSEPTSLAAASTTLPPPLSIPNNYNSFHNMHGLNFTFSQSSRPISPHFYIPNSSFSTSNSHPTVTLDLTAPPNNNNTSQYFNRFSSNSFPSSQRYSSACLNFSSSSSSLDTNSYFNYGSTPFYNRNQSGSSHFARTTTSVVQEQLSQPFMHMNNYSSGTQSLTDTIAAATKVIAANPTFRSALAAALTSVVGNGAQESGHTSGVEGSSLNLKLGESLFKQNVSVGCASSYSNKSSTMNREQQGSLSLFPSSLPLSKSRSSSGSSDNNN